MPNCALLNRSMPIDPHSRVCPASETWAWGDTHLPCFFYLRGDGTMCYDCFPVLMGTRPVHLVAWWTFVVRSLRDHCLKNLRFVPSSRIESEVTLLVRSVQRSLFKTSVHAFSLRLQGELFAIQDFALR